MTSASIDVGRFVLNGEEFVRQRPVGELHAILGRPTRILAAGPPPPPGHRNNQIHFYDEDGLYLVEHHYTYTIVGICFVLWRDEAVHKPSIELSCELHVGGVHVVPGLDERGLLGSSLPFEGVIPGHFSYKSGPLCVGFGSRGRKGLRGDWRFRRYVIDISVSFDGDPFETRYRP